MSKDWIIKELEKKNKIYDSVFIMNPESVSQIDKDINFIYSGIGESLKGTNLSIFNQDFKIEDVISESRTIRKSMFVLCNPDKITKDKKLNSLWYLRGEIICSMLDYFLSFDFILDIPIKYCDNNRIINLLHLISSYTDCYHIKLVLEREEKLYSITIQDGFGNGWLIDTLNGAKIKLMNKIKSYINLIKSIEKYENDLSNTDLLDEIENNLTLLLESNTDVYD